MELNKIDEVWNSASSLFKWRRFVVSQNFCYHGNVTYRLLPSITLLSTSLTSLGTRKSDLLPRGVSGDGRPPWLAALYGTSTPTCICYSYEIRTGRPDHGQTSHFDKAISFFQEILLKSHLLRAHYLGFDWSGWIVLSKSDILISLRWELYGRSVLTNGKRPKSLLEISRKSLEISAQQIFMNHYITEHSMLNITLISKCIATSLTLKRS